MSRKQTRRSVSIRGTTYDRVRAYCESHGLSMSEFVEDRVSGFFAGTSAQTAVSRPSTPTPTPQPMPSRVVRPKRSRALKLDDQQLHDAARYFTF